MADKFDDIDAQILALIQNDATLTVADIAAKVGLSTSPCWRRMKRLEEIGIIRDRVTLLDRQKLGLDFEVFTAIKLSLPNKDNIRKFELAVADMPEVMQCATVTGAVDFMLRIVTKDMHSYEDFLREELLAIDVISDVQSRIVLRESKGSHRLPLHLIDEDKSKA